MFCTMFILTTIHLFPSSHFDFTNERPFSRQPPNPEPGRSTSTVHLDTLSYLYKTNGLLLLLFICSGLFVNNINFIFHSLSQVRSIRNRIQSVRQLSFEFRAAVSSVPCLFYATHTAHTHTHTFRIQNRYTSLISTWTTTANALQYPSSRHHIGGIKLLSKWLLRNIFLGSRSVLCIKYRVSSA